MSRLRQKDRDAIVLRFFENRTVAEVALAMGLGEDAAQKRINRATDKLRKFFLSRGIQVSTHGMLQSIGNHAVQIAPAGLASSIATVASIKGVAAGGSTLSLMKGALKIMAWTKAKTAIVTGAVVLLAAGTTTVIVDKIVAVPPRVGNFSATDLSWADNPKYWATDSRVLEKLPAGVFIFRPTRFANSGGGVWVNNRMCVKDESVGDLTDQAYSFSYTHTVFPADMPADHFDVMATVRNSNELLKDQLKKQFGLTAHIETREMDVLLLKVQNPNPPNLKRHNGNDRNSMWSGGDKKITIQNEGLGGFFGDIESRVGIPVVNATGIKGRYDLDLDWHPKPGETEKDAYKRALSEQLGLELVPSRQPIKMLIVEKNNSL